MRTGDLWRRMWGGAARRPTNFGWLLHGRLAGSGRPMSQPEFDWLRRRGIRAVVTLTESALPDQWVQGDLQYAHLPVTDRTGPSPALIQRAVAFIETSLHEERPVLVHCAAGQGRTGTVLAAFLVKTQGLTPDEAIRTIRRLRPGSIESRDQEEAVRAYARLLSSTTGA